MNASMSKSVFAAFVAAVVLLGGQWASAGNLPTWGGATTTNEPQQIQQPRQPLVSAPAPITAKTVQPTQPRSWTSPTSTSSPTGSTSTQQPSYQTQPTLTPRTSLTPKQPSARMPITGTSVQRTATQYVPVGHGESQGYDSFSDPPDYSFAIEAAPDHVVLGVNQQGEVVGEISAAMNLKSIPVVAMDQNCDPWMTKLEFYSQTHYVRPPSGAPVGGELSWSLFNTVELPLNQSCYFDITVPLKRTFADVNIARFCGPDPPPSGKPTEIVVLAKAHKNTVVLITTTMRNGRPVSLYDENGNYTGPGPPPTNMVSGKINAAQVTIPVSFICENTP